MIHYHSLISPEQTGQFCNKVTCRSNEEIKKLAKLILMEVANPCRLINFRNGILTMFLDTPLLEGVVLVGENIQLSSHNFVNCVNHAIHPAMHCFVRQLPLEVIGRTAPVKKAS